MKSSGELFYEEIRSLTNSPLRCSRAPEDDHFEEEIRHLICDWYRVLCTVEEQTVHVLHVRHERQDTLKPEKQERSGYPLYRHCLEAVRRNDGTRTAA